MCPLGLHIQLNKGYTALVDPEDWVVLHNQTWTVKKSKGGYYAIRRYWVHGHCRTEYMHRVIMNTPKGFQNHHKNRNTLDNRRANIPIVTPAQHKVIDSFKRISKFLFSSPKAGAAPLPFYEVT